MKYLVFENYLLIRILGVIEVSTMCTVSYIPTGSDFFFTSNRDEDPRRAVNVIEKHDGYFYPKDPRANGTWYIVEPGKRIRCLLNGAFIKHQHLPPYSKSRGVMVIESMKYRRFADFAQQYLFHGIEPFTFIDVNIENDKIELSELRWDEHQIHFKVLDGNKAHIWSSSPLYTAEQQKERQIWFDQLIKDEEANFNNILAFHESQHGIDPNNFIRMKRYPGPQTISTTMYDSQHGKLLHKNQLSRHEHWVDIHTLSDAKLV